MLRATHLQRPHAIPATLSEFLHYVGFYRHEPLGWGASITSLLECGQPQGGIAGGTEGSSVGGRIISHLRIGTWLVVIIDVIVALEHGVVAGRWRTRIGHEEARTLEED